jgi:hypothetical protein
MNKHELTDLYFLDARARLIDLAAFLDRIERAPGEEDFRLAALRKAVTVLAGRGPQKAREVLMTFSDPTDQPIARAHGKGACGAWPGEVGT